MLTKTELVEKLRNAAVPYGYPMSPEELLAAADALESSRPRPHLESRVGGRIIFIENDAKGEE